MNNLEQIDDYLSNKLSAEEKTSFEKQLETDVTLREEVTFQDQLIKGIKQARITELKTMLNNVPVGSALSSGISAAKIGVTLITAGIIGTGLFYYFSGEEEKALPQPIEQNIPTESEPPIEQETNTEADNTDPVNKTPLEVKKKSNKEIEKSVAPPSRPKLDIVDPTEDLLVESDEEMETVNSRSVSVSQLDVEADTSHKKYDFHYQFVSSKLMLYGPFDKSLYEILEINGTNHTIFLFYKDNYYLLDEKKSEITKLSPIKDSSLLKLLKAYRNQ